MNERKRLGTCWTTSGYPDSNSYVDFPQLNAAQQAQTLLGDELQRVVEAKQSASDQPEGLAQPMLFCCMALAHALFTVVFPLFAVYISAKFAENNSCFIFLHLLLYFADLIKEQSNRIAQLQRQLSDTEEALALLQQEQSRDLTDREGRLAEEKALLEKQREALLEGRDEKELSKCDRSVTATLSSL